MLQKPWIKIFIWFMATFFFFLASGVIISIFKPGPTESEVMQFMMGMMAAMDQSMMGVAMNIEHHGVLQEVIVLSTKFMIPLILISTAAGFVIRYVQRRNDHVKP
ncbi:hypothetical protein [Thermotalea metallivorans]|uniref:Uncharacterized protein n=1 Tax=Thermotalea metallivorans TaxID=520762 RepID=A0A140LBS8_9FIRM|nr:hypothetical protein [Thermotalea metallivorans]KXG78003.1 hypothetical protein AN619_03130 [Thermotalea metallivorans]